MLGNRDNVLLLVVVREGQATLFSREARELLDTGHTTMLARGTAHEGWSQWLGVDEVRRELILMLVPKDAEDAFYRMAEERFRFRERHTGIIATIDVLGAVGMHECSTDGAPSDEEAPVTHRAVFVIVEKGDGEEIMDIAERAGARGGTLVHGRGAGIHEHEILFNMQVEPEKDILLIITPAEETPTIVDAIRREAGIDEPGRGMMFVVDISRVLGMADQA